MKNKFGHVKIVNKEEYEELNFNERISKLEKKVAKLEKENKEKDELLRPLSIAVACLCMFKKEELDKE